jgi:uncharacterized membrane protein
MKNVAAIIGLLTGPFGLALVCGVESSRAGQIGIATVFVFTALGHFVKQDEMMAMLPVAVPAKRAVVVLSGVLEVSLAVCVLLPASVRTAGLAICGFLVLVTPVNVYAALKRVDFGGHFAGPKYLFVRLPLQFLLLIWTYWFAVRPA